MQDNAATPPPIALSIAVLARDEAALLAPCLAALQWAGELLVVDGGSTDDTCAVARRSGARVIESPELYEDNFAARRNMALAEARHPWVLFVDVNERVSTGLQAEVTAVIAPTHQDGDAPPAYTVPRRNVMLGRPLHHGGWWPDLQVRLVRRGAGRYTGLVHEQFVAHTRAGGDVRPPLGRLSTPLTHRTHRSISEVVRRIDRYSDLQAREWQAARGPDLLSSACSAVQSGISYGATCCNRGFAMVPLALSRRCCKRSMCFVAWPRPGSNLETARTDRRVGDLSDHAALR